MVCSLLVTSAERHSPTTAIVKASALMATATRRVPRSPSGGGSPTVAIQVTSMPWRNAAVPSTRILLRK